MTPSTAEGGIAGALHLSVFSDGLRVLCLGGTCMPNTAPQAKSVIERIRTVSDRNAKALELRPSLGQGVAVTRVRMMDGLACEVEEGAWKFTVDLSEKSGGDNRGPNPGILGRAALGSCLAIGYSMWAARMAIPIDRLEVEVQADYDSRTVYAVGEVEPGYREVRYIVHVESSAPEQDVVRLLNFVDSHSDYLHVFAKPQRVVREVRFKSTAS
jgi:uncharacterized OsmC-like protein